MQRYSSFTPEVLEEILEKLKKAVKEKPYGAKIKDPFKRLIAGIISIRTKEEVTEQATERLFSRAKTPNEIAKLSEKEIAELIYPAGFYKQKAKWIKQVSAFVAEHGMPGKLEELVKLPGVGRKVAQLVLLAMGEDALPVDTHVHRIANRLGLVKTKSPEETEKELKRILPKKLWKDWNWVFVQFGRKICKPNKPRCDICPIRDYCKSATPISHH